MLAFASDEPLDVAPYLAHLARLSACGNLVNRWERRPGGNHPDGGGIACQRKGGTRFLRRGAQGERHPRLSRIPGGPLGGEHPFRAWGGAFASFGGRGTGGSILRREHADCERRVVVLPPEVPQGRGLLYALPPYRALPGHRGERTPGRLPRVAPAGKRGIGRTLPAGPPVPFPCLPRVTAGWRSPAGC